MMISKRRDVRRCLLQTRTRVGIMSIHEVTTDIPEYSDLAVTHPWARSRGVGATVSRPISICGEENVLRYDNDPHSGADILIHEFAHALDLTGLRIVDSSFARRLQQTYTNAMRLGRWQNTYAGTLKEDYWAEGVQSFFAANREADPPNGIHNHVNTPEELRSYDPELYTLIREVFPVELSDDERATRLSVEQVRGNMRLLWNTQPSVVYDVQGSSDLQLWTFVSDPRIGTTNSSSAELIQPLSREHNFFRLLLR